MRIGILTQYFPPELGAPQQRLSGLADRLAARGHTVIVLTAMPSYPTGRTFPGYGGLHRRERMGGVDVHRVAAYPTQSPRMSRRLLNYGSFVASSTAMGVACFGGRLDVLMTESPPLFVGFSGYALSRACRARWVFNVSDLWPDSAVDLGIVKPSPALSAAYAFEALCYRKAWLVTGQSEEIVANIARRFPGVATYRFSNGADTSLFRPERRDEAIARRLRGDRPCSVLYAGLHGLAQGLDVVVEAAGRLREAGAQVTLMGDGPVKSDLIARAARASAPVHFEPPKDAASMPAWVASADISLVTLGRHIQGAVPSKLYEAMGAARPVVLMASGESARIVERHQCGIVVSPGDAAGLAAAIDRLAADAALRERMGTAGREAAVAHFDRDVIVRRFAERLETPETRS